MRHQWPAGQHYEAKTNEMHSLWLFLEGEVSVQLPGEKFVVRKGMAFLCGPSCPRSIMTPKGARWLSVSLRAVLHGQTDILQLLRPPALWQPDPEQFRQLYDAMEGLAREWAGSSPFPTVDPDTLDQYIREHYAVGAGQDATSVLLCDAYARTIVGLCWRMLGKIDLEQTAGQGLPSWLPLALQELRADPDISIERLAHDIGISPTQLRRNFQKWFGASPREYLNRLRLEDARRLLETTELSVNDIAEHIGFLSPPHFSRLFKHTFGMPPAQYRQLSRINESQS